MRDAAEFVGKTREWLEFGDSSPDRVISPDKLTFQQVCEALSYHLSIMEDDDKGEAADLLRELGDLQDHQPPKSDSTPPDQKQNNTIARGSSAQFATELVANKLPYLQNMQLVAELARRIRAIPRDQRSAIERELVALVMSPDSEETCAALSHGLSFGDEALPTTTKEMNKNSRETHDAKSDTGKDIVRS